MLKNGLSRHVTSRQVTSRHVTHYLDTWGSAMICFFFNYWIFLEYFLGMTGIIWMRMALLIYGCFFFFILVTRQDGIYNSDASFLYSKTHYIFLI